ncbi:hypothetical protein GJ744_003768 [Endocarpon pusillum]|uniref:Uncharacterized protein n=1 Tax=Endocarpon pusillum TaxID=364733 RepID=A0A8H7ALX4_9EURO|nr:hypothetical protein GJ744_003768 [Endocarpon pusillum]
MPESSLLYEPKQKILTSSQILLSSLDGNFETLRARSWSSWQLLLPTGEFVYCVRYAIKRRAQAIQGLTLMSLMMSLTRSASCFGTFTQVPRGVRPLVIESSSLIHSQNVQEAYDSAFRLNMWIPMSAYLKSVLFHFDTFDIVEIGRKILTAFTRKNGLDLFIPYRGIAISNIPTWQHSSTRRASKNTRATPCFIPKVLHPTGN